jgi:Fic family protein
LYLSDFLEKNRRLYYDNLTNVRANDDLIQWIKFFLVGVTETAKIGVETFKKIIQLRNDVELNQLIKLGRKQKDAKRLINELYKQPILDANTVAELLHIQFTTANRLIADLEKLGILKELTGYKRNRMFAFEEYIRLF